MSYKFKTGDKVVLKSDPKVISLNYYKMWGIVLGEVYTIQDLNSSEGCMLSNGYWAHIGDIELTYSEMLKRVLE